MPCSAACLPCPRVQPSSLARSYHPHPLARVRPCKSCKPDTCICLSSLLQSSNIQGKCSSARVLTPTAPQQHPVTITILIRHGVLPVSITVLIHHGVLPVTVAAHQPCTKQNRKRNSSQFLSSPWLIYMQASSICVCF